LCRPLWKLWNVPILFRIFQTSFRLMKL
jgi:hypothetical protein